MQLFQSVTDLSLSNGFFHLATLQPLFEGWHLFSRHEFQARFIGRSRMAHGICRTGSSWFSAFGRLMSAAGGRSRGTRPSGSLYLCRRGTDHGA